MNLHGARNFDNDIRFCISDYTSNEWLRFRMERMSRYNEKNISALWYFKLLSEIQANEQN